MVRAKHSSQKTTLLEKFWSKVDKASGCWTWKGALDKDGYGHITHEARRVGAHKISFLEFRGEVPAGLYVLHKCDNPACVNPEHLFLGTAKDNYDDAFEKGRASVGEKNGSTNLTPEKVLAIRADTRRQVDIARDYGIGQTAVSSIKTGRNWRHLHG